MQLEEPLFHSHTHISFLKPNGTYHETFHSNSSADNFLLDMKRCTVLKHSPGCHSYLSPLAHLTTTLKTKGDPRERQPTKTLFNCWILFVQSFFLLLSHFISYYSYEVWQGNFVSLFFRSRKRGLICKSRNVNWVGQVTELISSG